MTKAEYFEWVRESMPKRDAEVMAAKTQEEREAIVARWDAEHDKVRAQRDDLANS